MPARQMLAAMLCLAFALTLAACGGGGGSKPAEKLYEFWGYESDTLNFHYDGTAVTMYSCHTLVGEPIVATSQNRPSNGWWRKPDGARGLKANDKVCWSSSSGDDLGKYGTVTAIQTKEDEIAIRASAYDRDGVTLGKITSHAEIDYQSLERKILQTATVIGLGKGYEYAVFDSTEERHAIRDSEVAGTTSEITGSETGMITPIYNTTFGHVFGNTQTTTNVQQTGGSIRVSRNHTVKFYHDEPNTDKYINLNLVMNSLVQAEFEIVNSKPTADYYYNFLD